VTIEGVDLLGQANMQMRSSKPEKTALLVFSVILIYGRQAKNCAALFLSLLAQYPLARLD